MTKAQYLQLGAIFIAVCGAIAASAFYGLGLSEESMTSSTSGASIEKADLPKPKLEIPPTTTWPDEVKRDPLLELVPDAHYGKDRREPPAGFREKWRLNGIVIAGRDEKTGEDIPACCFEGNERFYRIGDRLEGTEFTVYYIDLDSDRAYVDVQGDNGLIVKLSMLDMNRYK